MPFFRPVNLPSSIIYGAIANASLGIYLTVTGSSPLVLFSKHALLAPSNPITTSANARTKDSIRVMGLLLACLEITTLVSSYMSFEENQFMAAMVPVRLGSAAVFAGFAAASGVGLVKMSTVGRWEYVALAMVDAGTAVMLGRELGRFDGMVRGAERWF
ncbi:hypothetical protein BT63DRAFT_425399 [Microthyrium microscopicum]|uniref:Uncharacterized protein n=1 Tax=Microthyrium microscopicum TaxID=703497 RepID=A0A6A6UC55_9PEZI|nr:hypothetical protein BT63DRAFT_425399 [Microthyrium microscopicum]